MPGQARHDIELRYDIRFQNIIELRKDIVLINEMTITKRTVTPGLPALNLIQGPGVFLFNLPSPA